MVQGTHLTQSKHEAKERGQLEVGKESAAKLSAARDCDGTLEQQAEENSERSDVR